MARPTPIDLPLLEPNPNEKLTVSELCAELKVARSTFYEWRQKRCGPRCIRLPNGDLRIRRRDLDEWLDGQEVA
jgi:predicted DNA-binding transcriptional regulator AlpA